jgi:DNA-binding Lrp family transcriptional regulator
MNVTGIPDEIDCALLDFLQDDLPVVARPWQELAARLGIPEEDVVARLKILSSSGILRGISPVLESRPLGLHAATLVALRVPEPRIGKVAEIVSSCPEVSHNFLRDHEYALWFTIAAPDRESADRVLTRILRRADIPASDVLDLPTVGKAKIDVRFRFVPQKPGGT